MKIKKSNIIFLIRAYNEEKCIGNVIEEIRNAGYKNILVVDDGSTDKTQEIIKTFDNILYIKHVFNRGGGAALETGFAYLRKNRKEGLDYVVTFDADSQHNIKDIKKFIKEFEKEKDLDIVLGSRFIVKTNTNAPFIRKLLLLAGRIFTYLLSGIYLTDSHNGYRMIRIESLDNIHLTMDGMEYASELVEQIRKNKLKFKEVPVDITYTDYSLKKGQKNLNAFRIARKMIWSKFFK